MKRDNKGRFAAGNSGGGRPKGKGNRDTEGLRVFLENLINDNREQIIEDLGDLDAKDRLQLLEKLMTYVLPRMSSVQAAVSFDKLSDEQLNILIDELTQDV